jgi:hypothetical protein
MARESVRKQMEKTIKPLLRRSYEVLVPYIQGAASIWDFGNTLREPSLPEALVRRKDALAMRADWEEIGDDMKRAIAIVEQEIQQNLSTQNRQRPSAS